MRVAHFHQYVGVFAAVVIAACTAQGGSKAVAPDKERDPHADVMSEVQRVEGSLSTLDARARTLLGISAEGADVTAYLDGSAPRKIQIEALGETGKGLTSYYFQEGRLIFATSTIILYSHSISGEPLRDSQQAAGSETPEDGQPAETVTEREQFYFHENALIRWERANAVLSMSAVDYPTKARELQATARSYARWMSTPLTEEQKGTCFWTAEHDDRTEELAFHCE